MVIHLLCILTNGGLPIFQKLKGNCGNMPFSTVASLNGIYMFFKTLGISLQTTFTNKWILTWKEFHSITLILCGLNTNENDLIKIAEFIFYTFRLFIRDSEFDRPCLLSQMKREAKNYMPIVETILDAYEADIFGFNDFFMSNQKNNILLKLNKFSDQCGSLFCAFIFDLKLLVATEGWWDLHITDRKLLTMMIISYKNCLKDIPIYLPNKSPNVAFRFVTIPLSKLNTICVICGLQPPTDKITNLAYSIFNIERCVICYEEQNICRKIEENALSFLFLNKISKKYMIYMDSKQYRRKGQKLYLMRILQTLLKHVFDEMNQIGIQSILPFTIIGQHWCSETNKSYAILNGKNILVTLFTISIPSNIMRKVAHKNLSIVLSENTVGW